MRRVSKVPTMSERLLDQQQLARLLDRAAQLQEQATQRGAGGGDVPPEEGAYGLAEIQAAAAEAGIDERFVALAALDLAAAGTAPGRALTQVERRQAVRWLGAREPALAHVHRFRAPIDRLMAAIGAVVQAPKYGLRIADSTAAPRRGGTTLLAVPDYANVSTGGVNLFAYHLRGVFSIEHVRLTIEPRGEHDHDVQLAVDLEQAWPGMRRWGLGFAATFGALAALIAWAIAGKLAAPLLAAPLLAAATAAAVTWIGARLLRVWYRHAVASVQQQLRELLLDVDGALRSQSVFGVLPPSAPAAAPGPAGASADVVVID